jgi:hypothetical protein
MTELSQQEAVELARAYVSSRRLDPPDYVLECEFESIVPNGWLFANRIRCLLDIPSDQQEKFAGDGGFIVTAQGAIEGFSSPGYFEFKARLKEKPVESLTVADLEAIPVWQYVNDGALEECKVQPAAKWPVSSSVGILFGIKLRLGKGALVWGLVGNVVAEDPNLTKHSLTVSVQHDGKWFAMARYYDLDYGERGPKALARFLGMSIAQVFPISYDISRYCEGHAAATSGVIEREPRATLTAAQVIALNAERSTGQPKAEGAKA